MQTVKYSQHEPINENHIARLFQHRHWTAAIAEEVVEAWRQSGLTKRAFSRHFDVKPYRLEHWDRRLRKEKRDRPTPPMSLHPVKVTRSSRPPRDTNNGGLGEGIEMALPSGAVLRIANGFDAATLRRLLETVGC